MNSIRPIQHDDATLIAAVRDRSDELAFRHLYRRHTPRLLMFTMRVLGGSERDAEDVVQETWITACDKLDSFRGDAAFATWLTGIGLNTARNHLRRAGRRETLDLDTVAEPATRPATHEACIDLERAIELLPDGCRAILVLHDVEGWPHREIGRVLGISDGTSKSQLSAARRWLRAYLGPSQEVNHEHG